MVAPAPGSTPTTKPMTVPRTTGIALSRRSCFVSSISLSGLHDLDVQRPVDHVEHGPDAEEADRDREEAHAVHQLEIAEGEARVAGHLIEADHAERSPIVAIA